MTKLADDDDDGDDCELEFVLNVIKMLIDDLTTAWVQKLYS